MGEKYLIFDFDGVFGDTWDVFMAALVHNKEFASKHEAEASMHQYFAAKPNHTRNHKLTEAEMALKIKQRIKTGEYLHKTGFSLFDEFVKEVEAVSTPYKAVVSSGSVTYIAPAIATTNINPTHILGFEDHHSKEEKIEAICEDWNISIADTYYFTDSLADVFELQDFIAKDKLIGVSWGFCTKEQLLTQLSPEYILDTASDIHKVLK